MTEFDCKFINSCSDTEKLRESERKGIIDKDLEDQHYELCSTGGFKCLLKEDYQKREKI